MDTTIQRLEPCWKDKSVFQRRDAWLHRQMATIPSHPFKMILGTPNTSPMIYIFCGACCGCELYENGKPQGHPESCKVVHDLNQRHSSVSVTDAFGPLLWFSSIGCASFADSRNARFIFGKEEQTMTVVECGTAIDGTDIE